MSESCPVDADGLDVLLPALADWFRATFGDPTPPQRLGWPAIASGRNTLIFAPTGSGKTLAAFLACLDHLWRHPRRHRGAGILYVSPLKALNVDIARNLEEPLTGIRAMSERLGTPLPPLSVAVRTGDTPAAERQRLVRRPPDVLITTPESLHLMLTSRARETLRGISHVIVDEIHALAPNKRGVFLSLLLERLEVINPAGFVRIGLSATQRPLEEVARYLGGRRKVGQRFEPRPVTIVDAGRRKDLDLEVSLPAPMLGPTGGPVWPAIERRLLSLIESHRSTIVFANNRRVVERLTASLNELASDGLEDARTIARAHHGSLSLDARRATEDALKRGELPAVVATASLELGIDMGAVDLVCQVESPGGVARGLQRVGRAGHLVGRTSKGRLIAKTSGDLLESAALAHAMIQGQVEPLRVPSNCLDVLAQQVVACVAVDRWSVPELYGLIQRAYPYRDLTPAAFEAVLKMVSGRFGIETFRDLSPRISWDVVHQTLHPLPGTAQRALLGGGTIPETGQYPLYLGEGGPRLGELDEEFVLERRVGETFRLGTSTWRIESIDAQRVIVSPAEGRAAFMPFWRGEGARRTAELGRAVGELCRLIGERMDDPEIGAWLAENYCLEAPAARSLLGLIARQGRQAGAVPDDRTVLVETFRDPAGETGLAVLTPFGGTLHHALKLALQGRLRDRFGIDVACLHDDDGVLIRLPGMDDPPLNVFEGLTAGRAEELIRSELGTSALFGLRFRQNAGRALLMPRPDPGKRTPLWLQRLRARDLLQAVRRFPDFPIVVETYRECLDDDLDLPRFRAFLDEIEAGTIRVVEHRGEVPSPFASELIFRFTLKYLYEWDEPRRADRRGERAAVDEEILDSLLEPDAIGRVEGRLRGSGRPPRSVDEMAEWLRRLGDLAPSDLAGPMLGFLVELEAQGRARTIRLPGTAEPDRWIGSEDAPMYGAAFGPRPLEEAGCHGSSSTSAPGPADQDTGRRRPVAPENQPVEDALNQIVRRYLMSRALVGLDDLLSRYPIDPAEATDLLERWAEEGGLTRIETEGEVRWAERRNLDEVRRLSVALRRQESIAVPPEVFADFVARRQHAHPDAQFEGETAVGPILEQLQGHPAPAGLWESEILPRRIRGFRPSMLDMALASGGWQWRAGLGARGEPKVAFVPRDFAGAWPEIEESEKLLDAEAKVLEYLGQRGPSFVEEIARGSGMVPSRVREALGGLLGRGRVTNDRLDPVRPGWSDRIEALETAATDRNARDGRPRLGSFRRPASDRPEGRWSALPVVEVEPETSALAWAAALLDRFGVLTRETVALDPWAPPWRVLQPELARAELRGEVRRGYFVEGLSGIQYALAETAEELARCAAQGPGARMPMLLSSLDPANLYGSGAPFDVPLLEGGTARLNRATGNDLVLIAGRPVLIIEAQGRRLTGLAWASEEELRAALGLLTSRIGPARRVLKVETYNNADALASPAAPWLADLGFVRDYPGMAYYAGW